jgi:hypothetical protein
LIEKDLFQSSKRHQTEQKVALFEIALLSCVFNRSRFFGAVALPRISSFLSGLEPVERVVHLRTRYSVPVSKSNRLLNLIPPFKHPDNCCLHTLKNLFSTYRLHLFTSNFTMTIRKLITFKKSNGMILKLCNNY